MKLNEVQIIHIKGFLEDERKWPSAALKTIISDDYVQSLLEKVYSDSKLGMTEGEKVYDDWEVGDGGR